MRILIILFFSPFLLRGQESNGVESYFKYVNQADQHIMLEDWEQVVAHYENAFKYSADPFFTDIVNYLNSVILTKESGILKMRKITYWLNYLINEKRVKWNYLEEILIPNFLVSEYKNNFFYSKKNDDFKSVTDSVILQIFYDDQNVRPKNARYTKEDKIAIDSVDQVNWIRFNEFINKYGFPCEQNVSFSLGDYELWSIVSLLLRHFVQEGYGEEVIDILQKEFNNLKIPRNIIASVYDLENNMSGGNKKHYSYIVTYVTFIGANIYKPLIDYKEDNIALINKNRAKIYLPELEVSLKNSVCKSMCVEGRIKNFFIEPYVSMDNLPSFLFEGEEKQNKIKGLKIIPSKIVDNCPCERF